MIEKSAYDLLERKLARAMEALEKLRDHGVFMDIYEGMQCVTLALQEIREMK